MTVWSYVTDSLGKNVAAFFGAVTRIVNVPTSRDTGRNSPRVSPPDDGPPRLRGAIRHPTLEAKIDNFPTNSLNKASLRVQNGLNKIFTTDPGREILRIRRRVAGRL